jgi:hypothetical protein
MAVTMTSDPCPRPCPSDCPGHRLGDLRIPHPRHHFVSSRPPVHHRVPEHPPCRPRANDQGQARGQPCRPHGRTGLSDGPSARSAIHVYERRNPAPTRRWASCWSAICASRSSSRTRGVSARGRSIGMSCRLSGRSRWPLLTPTCSTRSRPSCGTAVTIATASGTVWITGLRGRTSATSVAGRIPAWGSGHRRSDRSHFILGGALRRVVRWLDLGEPDRPGGPARPRQGRILAADPGAGGAHHQRGAWKDPDWGTLVSSYPVTVWARRAETAAQLLPGDRVQTLAEKTAPTAHQSPPHPAPARLRRPGRPGRSPATTPVGCRLL